MPDQARWTPSCRRTAAPGARPGRPDLHRGDGRPGGVHRGPLPRPRPDAQALDRVPAVAAEFAAVFGRTSGRPGPAYRIDDADTVVVALGSVLGTQGRGRRAARRRAARRRARHHQPTGRSPPTRLASRSPAPRAPGRPRAGAGAGQRRDRDRGRSQALAGGSPRATVVAGLGGRAITRKSLRGLLGTAAAGVLEPSFLDLDPDLIDRTGRMRPAGSGPSAENCRATWASPPHASDRPHAAPAVKFYQVGQFRRRQPAARRRRAPCSPTRSAPTR